MIFNIRLLIDCTKLKYHMELYHTHINLMNCILNLSHMISNIHSQSYTINLEFQLMFHINNINLYIDSQLHMFLYIHLQYHTIEMYPL